MNADLIKEWGGAIAVFLSIGGIIYAWLTRRSKENTETIKAMGEELSARLKVIEKKQVNYDRRIQHLEDNFKHLPTREQISELKVALAQVSTTVDNTNQTITRMETDIRDFRKPKE
ncbi:MAG: DUF2730 family protein [Rhodobacteraceae bacterium]|nr:DUF2730 family protein [Paracoccaceae bacterium]